MKKTLTLLAVFAIGASVTYGQGLITILNTTVVAYTNGVVSGKASGTGAFNFEVLCSSDSTLAGTTANQIYGSSSAFALWTDTTVSGANGYGLNAGHITPGANQAATGWAAAQSSSVLSAPDSYIIVGWSAAYGNWATVSSEISAGSLAVGGFFGVTAAGYQSAGGNGYSAVALWGNPTGISGGGLTGSANQIVMNSVVSAPEPGTMALAALGGASLLLFRRRNK